jgi:hypothetical protein
MKKVNIFVAISALAFCIGHANAEKFDIENPFSEENKSLAYNLYRGAYQTLENGHKTLSSEGEMAIANASRKFKGCHINEYKIHQFWGTVRGGDPMAAGQIEENRKYSEARAFELQKEIRYAISHNNGIENEIERLEKDEASIHGVSYRYLETLKRVAQNLYNDLDKERWTCGTRQDESLVIKNLLTVNSILEGFDEKIIEKIIANSDAREFEETVVASIFQK